MEKNYWLDLFSPETWQEAAKIGYTVTGFRRHRWKGLAKIKQGDIFVCYLTGFSRFCGLLEVVSEPFLDETPIWKSDPFPSRVRRTPLVALQPTFRFLLIFLHQNLLVRQPGVVTDAALRCDFRSETAEPLRPHCWPLLNFLRSFRFLRKCFERDAAGAHQK